MLRPSTDRFDKLTNRSGTAYAGTEKFIRLDSTAANVTHRTVKAPVCSGTGSFRIVAYNSAVGSSASGAIQVTSDPVTPPLISGRPFLCDNETTTLTVADGYTSYSWANGPSGQSYDIIIPGMYTVTARDTSGCPASASVTVTHGTSLVATITVDGDKLTSTPGDSYTWFKDDEVLSAAGQVLVATASGEYQVQVTLGECRTLSVKVAIVVTGLEEPGAFAPSIFPNPTTGKFNLRANGFTGKVSIINSLGVEVHKEQLALDSQDLTIDLSNHPAGLYLISIPFGEVTKTHRLVLLK